MEMPQIHEPTFARTPINSADAITGGKASTSEKRAAADLIALRANDGNGRPRNVSATYRPGRVCTNRCSSILHIRSRHSVGDGERLSISPRRAAGAHFGDLGQGTLMKFVSSEGSIAPNVRPSRLQSVGFGSLLAQGATMQSFDRSR